MSVTLPFTIRTLRRSLIGAVSILAIVPLLYFAACSSGGDNGGGGAPPSNNPPTGCRQSICLCHCFRPRVRSRLIAWTEAAI